MSNSVNIPESVKEIKNAIARRIIILAEWQAKLAKSRKNSLLAMRAMQVRDAERQIAELREALATAEQRQV